MPLPIRTCRGCGVEFELKHNKPGNVNDCPGCSGTDVPTYRAMVAYPSKNSCLVEIELTLDHAAADRFNQAQRRNGCVSSGAL